jgi:hypothetical protein
LRLFEEPAAPNAIGQQVDPGSTDISELAGFIRQATENADERDLAVAEYEDEEGQLHYDWAFSRGTHAEKSLWQQLRASGVDLTKVQRLYSELEPCGPAVRNCQGNIRSWFPNADVTWSFRYPDEASLRETSAWRAYIRSLFH